MPFVNKCATSIKGGEYYPIQIGFRIVADYIHERDIAYAELPPHRVSPHANELQRSAIVKRVDSMLAPVMMHVPCVAERQVSTSLRLVPGLQHYLVPSAQWQESETFFRIYLVQHPHVFPD